MARTVRRAAVLVVVVGLLLVSSFQVCFTQQDVLVSRQGSSEVSLQATVFAEQDRALVRFRVVDTDQSSPSPSNQRGVGAQQLLFGQCIVTLDGSTTPIWSGDIATARVNLSDDSTALLIQPERLPALWDLTTPVLHRLNCTNLTTAGTGSPPAFADTTTRFGFRSFVADLDSGVFRLNGRKLFLRGNSINPPGRNIALNVSETHEFATAYLTHLRDVFHVNAVRIGDGESDSNAHWYDAADELGMLIFAGPYNNVACHGCVDKPAVAPPPPGAASQAVTTYKDVLFDSSSHPSFVILILGNEYDIAGPNRSHWWESNGLNHFALQFRALAANVSQQLFQWDPTHAILGDAGFGEGLAGQIFDDHTYYGWYQGDSSSYYLHEPVPSIAVDAGRGLQPQVFTECVGNYLTASGDFDVGGKNWAWALKWGGELQGNRDAAAHAARTSRRSIEIVRRNRVINPHLAGIMPFSTPFYYCGDNISSFADLASQLTSPVASQMQVSFAPVLLSVECWTPHVEFGAGLQFVLHVVNDDDAGRMTPPSMLSWRITCDDGTRTVLDGNVSVPQVPYFATHSVSINTTIPSVAELFTKSSPSGNMLCAITALLIDANATRLAASSPEPLDLLMPTPPAPVPAPALLVLDHAAGRPTDEALQALGYRTKLLPDVEAIAQLHPAVAAGQDAALIVGEDQIGLWNGSGLGAALGAFVERGGRVLLLQQGRALDFNASWLDPALHVYSQTEWIPHSSRVVSRGEPVHPTRSSHPIFLYPHVIERRWWQSWSPPSNRWCPADAQPAQGAQLPDTSAVRFGLTYQYYPSTLTLRAENERARRRVDALMNHAMGGQDQVVVEVFGVPTTDGLEGSTLVCGLGLVERVLARTEPVAGKVLHNLIEYTFNASRSSEPLPRRGPHPVFDVGDSIEWGVNYSSERGLAQSSGSASGLLVQACPFDSTCAQNQLGTAACGRLIWGPYNFTWMGHNNNLVANASNASASVVFRAAPDTKSITTVLQDTIDSNSTGSPTVQLEYITSDFQVEKVVSCPASSDANSPGTIVAVCDIASAGSHDTMLHLCLRFEGNNTVALQRTSFS